MQPLQRDAPNLVSLAIAVTGHRDLVPAEIPRLRDRVREFLRDLQRQFPALPILLITPIADGADRLVTEVAADLGIPLLPMLPMPRDIYRADFDDLSKAEFDRLLTLGEVIELPVTHGNSADPIDLSHEQREVQYAKLGVYIASHCHIPLALWDGASSETAGGTAQVVRIHQQSVIELIRTDAQPSPIDFSEDERDLVFHIICSRQSSQGPLLPTAGTCRWLTRDESEEPPARMPERYRKVFSRMETLNRDAAGLRAEPFFERLVPEHCDRSGRHAADVEYLYVFAKALANRFQRLALFSVRASYTLSALAGIAFVLFADLTVRREMLFAYLIFVSLGIGFIPSSVGAIGTAGTSTTAP